jgi:hypothetical protein
MIDGRLYYSLKKMPSKNFKKGSFVVVKERYRWLVLGGYSTDMV